MPFEVLKYKGQPLEVTIRPDLDAVDIKRAAPYAGKARFTLTGVMVAAIPFSRAEGSQKYLRVTPGGQKIEPILESLDREDRFFGMPALIRPNGTFEPPELPEHLAFARDTLKWGLTPELSALADRATVLKS